MWKLTLIVIAIVLSACSNSQDTIIVPCPKKVPKVPTVTLRVNKAGGLDKPERIKAFKLIRKLRLMEAYYRDEI